MMNSKLQQSLNEASEIVGTTWPLYGFVTSNPLVGFEKNHFSEALNQAKTLFGARSFPEVSVYRQAWERNEIDETEISTLLLKNGFSESPFESLKKMEIETPIIERNQNPKLNRIVSKWLAAFMDEGLAEWEMPNKNQGFYKSWRKLAKYDSKLQIKNSDEIPEKASETLESILKSYSKEECVEIFKQHLAALPGWTGYIKHRNNSNTLWQKEYPITFEDYLAVRFFIAKKLNIEILPKKIASNNSETVSLRHLWLQAWENSWQKKLTKTLETNKTELNKNVSTSEIPDAQFALCIDTRSELMRRHIENSGNYETFGYAGFFGIAMDYKNENDGVIRKSCPPIVGSAYQVSEIPQKTKIASAKKFTQRNQKKIFSEYFLKRMKNMLPSAFGYVEGSGLFYGFSLVGRTVFPGNSYRWKNRNATDYENVYEPQIDKCSERNHSHLEIPLTEKVAIVKGAFDLTGWKNFAPLVLFVGHGSHSANNPFGSSLDCGACAASPGRHNARMLAKIANSEDVKEILRKEYGFNIPEETVFIGAEHNTTTDEIVIFDSEVPKTHLLALQNLKANLAKAQQTATAERLNTKHKSVKIAHGNANNWSETRPEWGLAKNASFIIAPRKLTKNLNLDGRCFLHSYDWELDAEGAALEGIMQGPMVVTQWINNHYYFSTVDNETFGGGSKITHNVTGKFGVVQGNGGDLKMGLPLQSVKQSDTEMYHQPLRLSVVIQAPIERIKGILKRNANIQNLLDNEWIYLMVMDPKNENHIKRYSKGMQWESVTNSEKIEKVKSEVKEAVVSQL
ncbi:DUF2309 domain-containing protein [Aequorivita sp. CIP111184]|uniref:DUF2309 domain-containing protein n=1 Tax=Aequorivita sp. CIP111184 TaxID=2211356 RepID=UPI000DBBBCD3|nr:DUF2309 domain-containing protein [Aequorivita sp. CIP111184]SRX56142.1 hypothetical protein AEQU1_03169 [Aequorivita sp. CIP111184]